MSRGPWKSKQAAAGPVAEVQKQIEKIEALPTSSPAIAPAVSKPRGVPMRSPIEIAGLEIFGAVYRPTDGVFYIAREHVAIAKSHHGFVETGGG